MNKTTVRVITLVVGLLIGGTARAQSTSPTDRPGVDLGIRVGYAIPVGNISGAAGDGMNDNFWGAIPFVLEAAYRIDGAVSVGALFQYAILQLKENTTTGCENGVTCSGSVVRLGVQGAYHFVTRPTFSPWVGVGTGYEWMNINLSQGAASVSSTARGFEFLTLHAGAEFRRSPHLSIGPFVSFSIARYETETFETGGTSTSTDIADTAVHGWLQIGFRGVFSL